MATNSDGLEHESNVKRLKLDISGSGTGVVSGDGDHLALASSMRVAADPVADHSDSLRDSPLHPDTSQESIDADDDKDNASTISDLSGLSELSGQDWKPHRNSYIWVQKQMQNGVNPRTVLARLGVDEHEIPKYVDDDTLWKLICDMVTDTPPRHKLRHVTTLDDVVRLLKDAKKIIVLTGAGVSVSCGIPDFRSRDGVYSRLAVDFPDLPEPQSMFDITYFGVDPRPFFKFARDIYPGKFQPSPCHRFIKLLEKHKKLLRNYTQNIDTLEKEAGIERLIECHGSFATATCTKCAHKVTADAIRDVVLAQNIPVCALCRPEIGSSISIAALSQKEPEDLRELVTAGIMKPDIVFFGEGLSEAFHDTVAEDKNDCDLLVVIGSSLKVKPVALIPNALPASIPQILINRESLYNFKFDVELLGDCDVIINHLCHKLGENWEEGIYDSLMLKEALHLLPPLTTTPSTVNTTKNLECEACGNDTNTHCECKQKLLSIKERHMSVDSARDSGIGENSNFTDVDTSAVKDAEESDIRKLEEHFLSNFESEYRASEVLGEEFNNPSCSISTLEATTFNNPSKSPDESDDSDEMQEYWKPNEKCSITDRLPPNSYYLLHRSRYIFPGAEVYYDEEEKCSYLDVKNDSDSDDSDIEAPEMSS